MKKNERISIITKILSDHPNEVFSYNYFTDLLGAGKSSVCEDVPWLSEPLIFRAQAEWKPIQEPPAEWFIILKF